MTIANRFNPSVRKWTREEYYRMGELGFFDGQRVQLIEGEIVEMAPQKDVHAAVVSLCHKAVGKAFGEDYWVRMQLPLQLGDASEPEPDVSVVKGNERSFIGTGHPTGALLIVEVSDSTLRFDRKVKRRVYSGNHIQDYWIVNLLDRQVEVHRKPAADSSGESTYGEIITLKAGQFVAPLAAPGSLVAIADMLP